MVTEIYQPPRWDNPKKLAQELLDSFPGENFQDKLRRATDLISYSIVESPNRPFTLELLYQMRDELNKMLVRVNER